VSKTVDFERRMKEASRNGASLCEGFHEGDLDGGLLSGDPERYVKQGSEMGVYFHRGPDFEEYGMALLSYDLLT
jgi:hypothetical protein